MGMFKIMQYLEENLKLCLLEKYLLYMGKVSMGGIVPFPK